MEHILEVLDKELKHRKEKSKEFYRKYEELHDEIEQLKRENQALRNDLFQLSLNHFKNKENGKEENYVEGTEQGVGGFC